MTPITITIQQGPQGVELVTNARATFNIDPDSLTQLEQIAHKCITDEHYTLCAVTFDPKEVPLITLAESLLHPEQFGWSVSHEVRDCAREALGRPALERRESHLPAMVHLTQANYDALQEAKAERDRLHALINTAQVADFMQAVPLEKAHQVERWGMAEDRSKSAEQWFWLVAYLSGKALRAAITGDKQKALHHTISTAAALANWHNAIACDQSGAGLGADADLAPADSTNAQGTAL